MYEKIINYAANGALIGGAIGAVIGLLSFHPLFFVASAVCWGIVGAGVGAAVGLLTWGKQAHFHKDILDCKDAKAPPAPALEPEIAQSQGQEQPRTYYQDVVTNSRITETPVPPQR